jgi:GNAT superfamily N-acetyltransferase
MNPDIDFRDYRRTDLPACVSIAVEAFPLIPSRIAREEARKVMKTQIDSCYVISNHYELAIVDGEVAGLLFGQVKRKSVLINMCRAFGRLLLMKVHFLLGRYGSRRKAIALIGPSLQALRVLRRNMPASEAIVVLFAVASKYQGKGIGRALMDRFVRHALGYKVKAIAVPTDETASFWFYERYGFRRWAEYEDPLESYLAGRPIKGFIYQLLLDEPDRQVLDSHK